MTIHSNYVANLSFYVDTAVDDTSSNCFMYLKQNVVKQFQAHLAEPAIAGTWYDDDVLEQTTNKDFQGANVINTKAFLL